MTTMTTLTLPRITTAPARTRRYLRPRLHALGFPEDAVFEMLVATSEAVTNAILHGARRSTDDIKVSVVIEDSALTITVTSPRTDWLVPRLTLPDPSAERGRGLYIMQRFTDSYKITQGPEGTTVSLTRRLPEARARLSERDGTPPRHPQGRSTFHH